MYNGSQSTMYYCIYILLLVAQRYTAWVLECTCDEVIHNDTIHISSRESRSVHVHRNEYLKKSSNKILNGN